MIEAIKGQYVWTEKYRPTFIKECILPESIKKAAEGYVKEGRAPTILLSGGAGMGKTTLAKCIANELDADFMIINASMERGIDIIRTKIMQFASTVSFSDSKKITLLDEADSLTAEAQSSLRAFIEEFSGNHSIFLTCNYKHKLIEPLHSRCQIIDFKIPTAEKSKLNLAFFKRVCDILDTEKVEYDKKVIAEVIMHFFPDFRRCLNELQKYSVGGKIDSGILVNFSDESIVQLITHIKNKKFGDMRRWVALNCDNNPTHIFRQLYDKASTVVEGKSIPPLILILGEYSYKAAFVADQEINLAACLTEIILDDNIVWK